MHNYNKEEKKQKRLLIVFNQYTPDLSKPDYIFYRLAEDLKIKIDIVLCSFREKGRPTVEFKKINNDYYKLIIINGITFGNNQHFNPSLIFRVAFNKYDLILIGGYGFPSAIITIILCKVLKKKWGIIIDGFSPWGEKNKLKFWIKKQLLKGAAFYLVSDKNIAEILNKNYNIDKKIICNTFATTSDLELFLSRYSREEILNKREQLEIPSNAIVILYVGRMISSKGVKELFEVFCRLSTEIYSLNIFLLLIGEGPLVYYIKNKIEKEKISNVRLIGFVPHHLLPLYYQSADIFVSFSYGDVWGYTIVEAIASGLPVITTDKVNAAKTFVKEKYNGFIIPVGDIDLLYQHLKEISLNSNLRHKLADNSKKLISKEVLQKSYNNHLRILKSLL